MLVAVDAFCELTKADFGKVQQCCSYALDERQGRVPGNPLSYHSHIIVPKAGR